MPAPPLVTAEEFDAAVLKLVSRITALERKVVIAFEKPLALIDTTEPATEPAPTREKEIDLDALFAPLMAKPATRELVGLPVAELYELVWDERFAIFADTADPLNWFEWKSHEEEDDPAAETHPFFAGGALFIVWRNLYFRAASKDEYLLGFLDRMADAAQVEVFRQRVAKNFHRIRFSRIFDAGRPVRFNTQNQALGVLLSELRKRGYLERWEGKASTRAFNERTLDKSFNEEEINFALPAAEEAPAEPPPAAAPPVVGPPQFTRLEALNKSAGAIRALLDAAIVVPTGWGRSRTSESERYSLLVAAGLLVDRFEDAAQKTVEAYRIALRQLQGEDNGT